MKSTLKSIFITFVAGFCLGCGASDPVPIANLPIDPGPNPQPTVTPEPEPEPRAHLRVFNSNFRGENLILSVDGAVVDSDFDPFESTAYIELEPGQHEIVVQGTLNAPISAQTENVLLTETVELADGTASTFIFANVDLPRQSDPEVKSQLLSDDVTPATGQLNARLVNVLPFPSAVSLLDEFDNLLLGPVQQDAATVYSVIDLSALQASNLLKVLFDEGEDDFVYLFSETRGNNGDLIDSLLAELDLTGVNITCIVGDLGEGPVLILLVDDLDRGDTSIVSEGESEPESIL